MKGKSKFRNTLLAMLLSLAMVVTYMPAWLITYAENDISEQPVSELNADVPDGDSAADETGDTGGTSDSGEITNDSGDAGQTGDSSGESGGEAVTDPSDEQTDEQADGAKGPDGLEEGTEGDALLTEEGEGLDALDAELEAEEEEPREDNRTVLAFTSDIHNASNNTAANRLDSWLDIIQDKYEGELDVMSFCGDMGAASANESQFWTYTTSVMSVVDGENIPGVYTTGNHEFYNGKFSSTSSSVKEKYIVGEEGFNGPDYRIYCLGTDNWNNNSDNYTTGQITKLTNYLNSVGTAKPIIILTHFPLHYFNGRSTTNADKVIDALNNAAESGQKIVLLWGHNHTVSDQFYDQIYAPGSEIPYNSNGSKKTFNFYYGAAGCMSDSEYGDGSAYVKGKGLVITINAKKQLSFAYYNATGTNVTEGGTYTEQDPVSAQGISVSPETLEVEQGRSGKISVTFTPSDTTNKGVTWTSSNEDVATVTNGKVKGVSVGTATITATSVDGGFTASCAVTVTERTSTDPEYVIKMGDYVLSNVHSDDVYSSGGSSSFPWGGGGSSNKYYGLEAVEYSKATKNDDSISWTITEADEGGGYYITDSEGNYLNATYSSSSGSYYGGSSEGDLKVDGTKDIWVLDDGITLDNWEVDGSYLKSTNASDRYLAQVQGTGGTQMFTNRSKDNTQETTIEDTSSLSDAVNATAIALSPKTLSVEIGASKKLSVTYTPSTTTNKNVTWTSSDTSVATVSATGQVTGVAKGKATITATYSDGVLTDTAEVTVTKAAGSGVTPEAGKKYVILAGDGYALTSEGEEVGYSNGSDSQKYYYYGLSGEAYTLGQDVIPERLLWTFTAANRAGSEYYIQDQNGNYLNGSYEANDEGGYTGRLALSDEPDIWVITGATSGDTVSGNILQSTNASASDAGAKFLTHGNGDNGGDNTNIFTLRSEDNATAAIFYEYSDEGTYIPDPDEPTPDDPTPTETTVDITPSTSNPSESAKINVGDTLTINVKNGSSNSGYDYTATLSSSGVAQIEGASTITIAKSETGQFTVKGIAEGTVDINIKNDQSNDQYARKAVIHLTVGEGSTPDDPTPTTGTTYKLVDSFTDGNDYLIVSANAAGSAYAMTNPGGTSSGASMGRTAVTVKNGDVDGDGTADLYIESDAADIVWKADTNKSGFNLTNDGGFLEGKSGNVRIFSSQQYPDRYWTYNNNYLLHEGGSYTYEVYYSNGFTFRQYNSGNPSNKIYIYEKTETATGDDPVESVELDKTELTLTEGDTETLTATVKPATAGNKKVTWASSDISVATVDQTGKVTAVKAGNATITVTTEDGGKSATCAVTVEAPAPFTGDVYKLVDSFTDGKDYLIVSANAAGSAYALKNPGGTSGGASMGRTAVTVKNGDVDGDGTADLYIENEATDVVWKAAANGSGFNLSNDGDTIEGKSGEVKIFSSAQYADRYWTYSDNQLKHVGGNNTYVVYYSNGFTSTYNSSSEKIYIYEKTETTPGEDPVDSVELNKNELTLTEGDTETLTATVKPATAANKKVTWASSDDSVATVDQTGKVTAVKAGTATITVTTEDGGKTATCAVTVEEAPPAPEATKYVLTDKLEAGKDYLIVNVADVGSSSSRALKNPGGTADGVKISSSNGKTTVTVKEGNIIETEDTDIVWTAVANEDGVYLINGEDYLEIQQQALKVFNPVKQAARYWTYEDNKLTHNGGSNPYYVTYSNGSFASSTSEATMYIFVKDVEGTDSVESVELNKTSMTLTEGDTETLTATVKPATAANKNVTWASSDEAVATVDQTGKVTAVKAGTANITVTTEDGNKTATCAVTVEEAPPAPEATKYVLTDTLEAGKDYLIVNVAEVGSSSSRALKNPGGTASGASPGKTTVMVLEGNIIETADSDIVWTATTNGDGVYLTNNGDYLEVYQGNLRIYNPVKQAPRYWTYTDHNLAHRGGSNPYYVAYNNGSFSYSSSAADIYLFVKVEEGEHTHTWDDGVVTTEPTCTEPGIKTYTCTECDETRTEEVAALGHHFVAHEAVAPTCTAAGNSAYLSCDRCDKFFSDTEVPTEIEENSWVIPATGHTWGEWTVTTAPTCTSAGEETRTCSNCDAFETREVAALGHHLEAHAATAATCTSAGNSAFWSCDQCGKFFSDAQGTTEIQSGSWAIPATGHTPGEKVTENNVAPTCTSAGSYDEVVYCTVCNAELSRDTVTVPATGHEWGEWTVTTQPTCTTAGVESRMCSKCGDTETRPVASLGHNLTPNAAIAPTCTAPGNSAYWICEQCGKYFSDEDGTEEITSGSWVIPAKGHTPGEKVIENNVAPTCTDTGSYDEVVYCTVCDAEISRDIVTVQALGHTWGAWTVNKPATEREEGEESRTCSVCDETETRPIPKLNHQHGLVHVDAKAATCTEDGNNEHWVCSEGNFPCGRLFADSQGSTELNTEEVVIPATGHAYELTGWTWADDNSSATATFTCKNDSTHVETVNAVVTSEKTDATCEDDGSTIYTATAEFEGRSHTYEKEVPIPATGHDYELVGWTWADDNSSATASFTCKNDSSHVETVNAVVSSATTNATCESAGKTVYTALATLGDKEYTDTREDAIPATGHAYELTEWTWAADYSSATAKFTCKNDSTHVETVDADVTADVTESTCDVQGKATYTAVAEVEGSNATNTKEINLPKKAHDWGDPTYAWEGNSEVTATRICKNFENHTETETVSTTSKVTKEATCTAKGEKTYTATFSNSAFKPQTKTEEVAALGHKLVATPYKAPTTSAAGNTAYYTCSRCGKFFSDAAGTKEIAKNSWILPAIGVPAVTDIDTTIKGTTSCIVTWTGNSAAVKYRLAYKPTGGSYKYIDVGTAKTYTVTGLSANKTYVFTVAAQNSIGEWGKYYYGSAWCYRFTGITSPKATAKSGKVTVSWSKITGATGYDVRYGYSGGTKYTKSTTGASLTFSAGSKGKTVVYQVRPYKTVSGRKYLGAWSNQKSITAK